VPVEAIAYGLEIEEIRHEQLDGCEGVLLTDRRRSQGKILVNSRRGRRAARFGIGHELGHFLMEWHVLGLDGKRTCTGADMRETRRVRQHHQQETEANAFAIGLLAPRYLTAPILKEDPDLDAVMALCDRLDLSLEACARCLVERHHEPIAAVWAKDGIIRYLVRTKHFPRIKSGRGERVARLSQTHAALARDNHGIMPMVEIVPAAWTGADIPQLFEQVRIGQNGHSLTLLWATLPDAEDD
jgi:Zn-dependent peptidase ImmA (M78 family)